MPYNKEKAVKEIIKINKLFNEGKKYNISTIIEDLFKDNFNIYKKKVLNIIINTILYKKNINDHEKNIIIEIINKIKNKNMGINVVYYDILINIIDTIYLRKSIGSEKNKIIKTIDVKFNELRDYIKFAKLGSEKKENEEEEEEEKSILLKNYSKIKVYVYKVFHSKNVHKNNNEEYSFSNGIKKINKKNSNYIKSNQNSSYIIDDTKIYSKDIIASGNMYNNKNTINDLFNIDSNISNLYKLYRTMSTRSKINLFSINTGIIYNNINYLLNSSIKIMREYLKKTCNNLPNIIENNCEIIYNISISKKNNTKIIVMGDQHGSLHSFFRIFIRLIISGIIDKNFKLEKDYKIIFLGDIIDRGNFGIEIMYIILKLIDVNNSNYNNYNNLSNLKVILIRGNHEDKKQFNQDGFSKEIQQKFANPKNIIDQFVELYSYCPSAIILKHKDIKYWLCHGGFNIKDASEQIRIDENKCIYRDLELKEVNVNYGNGHVLIKHKLYESQIRWNDFTKEESDSGSDRNTFRGQSQTIFNIGTKTLKEFLETNNINFIIRGHTDNLSNAMLLNTGVGLVNKEFLYLNNKNDNESYKGIFEKETILDYAEVTNNKCNEEIVTIDPIQFSSKGFSDKHKIGATLYPVLTISNNSDHKRYQYDDSYIIIE